MRGGDVTPDEPQVQAMVSAIRERPWVSDLDRLDGALARKELGTAMRAWHDAYGAALGSRRWEAMIDVGDAAVRLGHAVGSQTDERPKARRAYLSALFSARERGSVDGVLRAAQAFVDLGDRELARQAVGMAERMIARTGDPALRARVGEFAQQLAGETDASGPF
jgi:hypothetical protein